MHGGMAPPSSSSSSSPRNQRSAHLRKQPPAPSQTPPKLLNRNAVPPAPYYLSIKYDRYLEFGSTPKNPWPYFPPRWRECRNKSVGDRFISLRSITRGQAKDPSSITFTNCRMWVISTISTQYVQQVTDCPCVRTSLIVHMCGHTCESIVFTRPDMSKTVEG